MSAKPVVARPLAQRDIDEALAHYGNEGGVEVALRFIDAVARAFGRVGAQPRAGSARHAHELELEGLRAWPVPRFPYLVFYVERADHIDVWRVLHAKRDIPAWMQDPDGT